MFLLSPSETTLAGILKDEALVSPLPEEKGADILAYTNQGLLGIQRKSVPHDFLSSVTDGRMARLTSLLRDSCPFPLLLCEGRFRYFPDGRLVLGPRRPGRFTRDQIRGILLDIKYIKGVTYDFTDNPEDTVRYIKVLVAFMNKEKHLGLFSRPSAKGTWYTPSTREIDLWILQSFEGIGPSLADNIVSHFGGRVPLRWSCTLEQLMAVPKLSAKRAKLLWASLPGTDLSFDGLRRMLRR